MATPGARPAAAAGINPRTIRALAFVLLSGAVGGLLFWVVAKWAGTPLPTVFGRWIVLVLMFVGALAAAFGVYLLTASDLNAIRTYIFAVVCGLAWQPMIQSAIQIASNATATSRTTQVGNQVAQIKAAANGGTPQQISSAVENTALAVNHALTYSTNVTDAAKKAEMLDSSKEAINEIQSSATKAPDASVNALKTISLTAANSGDSAVAIHAIETLHTIGSEATRNNNRAVTEKVQQSLAAVAAESKDTTIRAAAKSAASQF